MIAKFYGRIIPIQKLRELCQINRNGVSLLGISQAAEKIGFRTTGAKLNLFQIKEAPLPCIIHWQKNHFVILYKISKNVYYISDPALGLTSFYEKDFINNWQTTSSVTEGISLLLSPTPQFYHLDDKEKELNWKYVLGYFYQYKALILQLFASLIVGTILSLITPFLTQSVVDIGINTKNINFVYLILIAQIMLFIGGISVNFVRSWILLHISTRINISILTDFLIKLMKLPVLFFETKTIGDIMQRINDQHQIQNFLTGTTLNTIFSLFNLVIFTLILAYYNTTIFLVSLVCTILYTGWILMFLKSRKRLNYSSLPTHQIIKIR